MERRYKAQESAVFRYNRDEFGDLSNFATDFPYDINGVPVLTNEALFQALKFSGSPLAQKRILEAKTPAAAKTRIFDQMTPEFHKFMLSKIPRARFLEIDELASLVTWLATEENSFSTGAVWDISGGRSVY